jgi:hypothetical protein
MQLEAIRARQTMLGCLNPENSIVDWPPLFIILADRYETKICFAAGSVRDFFIWGILVFEQAAGGKDNSTRSQRDHANRGDQIANRKPPD